MRMFQFEAIHDNMKNIMQYGAHENWRHLDYKGMRKPYQNWIVVVTQPKLQNSSQGMAKDEVDRSSNMEKESLYGMKLHITDKRYVKMGKPLYCNGMPEADDVTVFLNTDKLRLHRQPLFPTLLWMYTRVKRAF